MKRLLCLFALLMAWPVMAQQSGLPAAATSASVSSALGIPSGCTTTGNLVSVGASGTFPCLPPSASTVTQWAVNAVKDEGFDNTGATDNSAALQAWENGLTTGGAHPLYVPCGTYKFTSGTTTSANGIVIIGEGSASISGTGCVIFEQTMVAPIIWFNGAGVSQQQGPIIDGIAFQGSSSGVTGQIGLRFSDYQYMHLGKIAMLNYEGTVYTAGTVSVANGSTTVTGVGTSWTAAMAPGAFWGPSGLTSPAYIPQLICPQTAPTSTTLTLCEPWQGATMTASSNYSVDTGIAILMDGGTTCPGGGCFTQYGSIDNLQGIYNRMMLVTMGDGTNNYGVSRIDVKNGNIQGNRLADSIGLFAGTYTDTTHWGVSSNNYAYHVVLEETSAMDLRQAYFENDGTQPVVTTCNGGVASKACTVGVYVNGASASHTFGNRLNNMGANGIGQIVALGPNASHTQIYGLTPTDQGNTAMISLPGTGSAADKTTFTDGMMADYDRSGSAALSGGTVTHTFSTGLDNNYFANAPRCNAWDTTTPADIAYATISSSTPWIMTLHGNASDNVSWHCDLSGY